MARKRLTAEDKDSQLFRVLELYVQQGKNADEIAEIITREYRQPLKRSNVYPMLRKGADRGYLRLAPPWSDTLRDKLAARFGLKPERIHVVNASRESADEQVPAAAAEIMESLIRELGAGGTPVHLGLGPGRASRIIARNLALALRASEGPSPNLALHTITAGCPSRSPEYAPLAFFSFFEPAMVTEAHALFAEPAVPCEEYDVVKSRPGFARAFAERDKIDIVGTSLGDAADKHDMFRNLHEGRWNEGTPPEHSPATSAAMRDLKGKGWRGNVQFRPYSDVGIIREGPKTLRVPTLFELEDLRKMASQAENPERRRAVILCVHPCGRCKELRTRALLPLLTVPELRIWSELVIDASTVQSVLEPTLSA